LTSVETARTLQNGHSAGGLAIDIGKRRSLASA